MKDSNKLSILTTILKKINIILEKNFFIFFFFISIIRNSFLPSMIIILKGYLNNIKLFRKKNIQKLKKSDTLFILGGGESINDINEAQWNEIENSDTLGINRWLIHKYAPSFMLIEGAKQSDIAKGVEANHYYYDLLIKSNERCINTTFIFKDFDSLFVDFTKLEMIKKRSYLLLKFIIPGSTIKYLEKSLKIINKIFFLKNTMYPPGTSVTISHALSFALLAKYQKIVLCGIDLSGPYFWHSKKVKNLFTEPPNPKHDGPETEGGHKTANKALSAITADEIINTISLHLRQNKNQKIYINSKKSLLAKYLPIYWTDN